MTISTLRKLYQFAVLITGGIATLFVAIGLLVPLHPVAAAPSGGEQFHRQARTIPFSITLTPTIFLPLILRNASSPPPPPTPAPDLFLALSPATQTVTQGDSAVFTVSLGAINDFTAPVTLTAVKLPAGVQSGFIPNPITPTAQSVLTLSAAITTPTGANQFTVQAVSGSSIHTATAELSVTLRPQPDLAVQSLSIRQRSPAACRSRRRLSCKIAAHSVRPHRFRWRFSSTHFHLRHLNGCGM